MALYKPTTLTTGVTADYYRISELVAVKLKIRIKVEMYLNAQARVDGRAPIMENCYQKIVGALPQGFSFTASDYDVNFYDEAYVFLKTLPMFSGATDV